MGLVGLVVVEDSCARHGLERWSQFPPDERIANRPIVHHVLDALEETGVEDVVVASSSHLSAEVESCVARRDNRVRLCYVHEPGPLHLTNAIRLAAPIVGEAPCIVHAATGLLGEPLAPYLESVHDGASDLVMIVHHPASAEERLSESVRDMLHVAFIPERAALGLAGVCILGAGTVGLMAGREMHSGPTGDVAALAADIRAAGGRLLVSVAEKWRRYRGHPSDLLELNRIVLDRLEGDVRRPDTNGNKIEGRVKIHTEASVVASVIVGPAVIGARTRIRDAYVGPYTSIGPGATIEGAEIERSIISAGASVTHVGTRIAGSVVGRGARVFRDFTLPRALRIYVGDRNEVALS